MDFYFDTLIQELLDKETHQNLSVRFDYVQIELPGSEITNDIFDLNAIS